MIYDLRINVKRLFSFFVFLVLLILFTKDVFGLNVISIEESVNDMKKDNVLGLDVVGSDVDVLDLEVLSMEAPEIDSGDPVRIFLDVENKSNTALSLDRVELEAMDLSEELLESLSDISLPKIDPLTTKKIQAEFDSNLEKGKYRVDATAIFMGERVFSKKMILEVNAKPVKIREAIGLVKDNNKVQFNRLGRRLGIILMVLGLLLLVFVLVFHYRVMKDTDTKIERKLTEKLKYNQIMAWSLVGVSTFLMAFGFYLYLTSSIFVRV